MRKFCVAAVAAIFASVGTASAATFYSWQGDLFITAASPAAACNAVRMRVGDFARGVFRPRNLGDNGPNDLLAWHFGKSAGQIAASGPLNGETTAAFTRYIYGSGGFGQLSNMPLSGVTVAPSAPVIGTPTIAITMTIPNVYSSPPPAAPSGCNIQFKGTLAKPAS